MSDPLILGTDAAGPRHLLAERPVPPDTLLELLTFTGWRAQEVVGKALAESFHVINEHTRKPIEDPLQVR